MRKLERQYKPGVVARSDIWVGIGARAETRTVKLAPELDSKFDPTLELQLEWVTLVELDTHLAWTAC